MNQGQVIKYNILRIAEKNPDLKRKDGTVQMSKIAKACGLKPQWMDTIMKKLTDDECNATIATLSKIAKGLNCNIVDLLQVKLYEEMNNNDGNTANFTPDKP
jgi:DNA-binding Xre family transcriptional regulator